MASMTAEYLNQNPTFKMYVRNVPDFLVENFKHLLPEVLLQPVFPGTIEGPQNRVTRSQIQVHLCPPLMCDFEQVISLRSSFAMSVK